MRYSRNFVFLACIFSAALCFADKKEDWLTLGPQELQIKEVPGDAGAPAIQLYYAQYIDNSNWSQFVHKCIKVLNEKGKKYADVEIVTGLGIGLKDLKARTIHPDGSIVEFTGKPYDKTLFKGRGIKVMVKSFTLPDVTVGSIIEYKYTLTEYAGDDWTLQHDLYTVRQNFKFVPGISVYDYYSMGSRIAWVTLHSKDIPIKKIKDNNAELEMQNVPAFAAEDSMPPEENYQPTVRFFYVPGDVTTADKYWDERSKLIYDSLERWVGGNHSEVKEAAARAIGSETDPEKKLRLLYARAQQIRNLSYERERTQQELKKEKLKDNEGLKEILRRGYGDRSDITLLFAAMARAAGFDASILLVSSRKDRFFEKVVLSSRQLDSEIVQVNLGGKDIYLDPGTKYCPYGLLRWWRTSTMALKPDKKTAIFIVVPAFNYEKAQTRRNAVMALDDGGNLKGELTVQFQDLEALEHRLDASQEDQAGREKDLEEEAKTWLPNTAIVKFKEAQGWEDADKPLTAVFTVELPAYASVAGKRLLVPASLFQLRHRDAFNHPDRKYPLYFPYAFTELDTVRFKVPSGFSMESVPQQQDARLPYASYRSASQMENNELVTRRALYFNVIFSDVPKFPELKEFFGKVQAGDEQQAVLKAGGSVNAQKSN